MSTLWEPKVEMDATRTGGARPAHVHGCPGCKKAWSCDSPYCNYQLRRCEKCGGKAPRHDED